MQFGYYYFFKVGWEESQVRPHDHIQMKKGAELIYFKKRFLVLQSKHIKSSVTSNEVYRCLAVMLLFLLHAIYVGDLGHGQCQKYYAEEKISTF